MFDTVGVRKLFNSPLFLFLYFTVIFGMVFQLFSRNVHDFSWSYVVYRGIPFGLVMATLTLRKIRSQTAHIGITNVDDLQTMRASLKTGELPADPVLRKAMPVYLDYASKPYLQFKKYDKVMVAFFVLFGALTVALGHDFTSLAIAIFILTASIVSFRYTRRQTAILESLYEKLKVEPGSTKKEVDPLVATEQVWINVYKGAISLVGILLIIVSLLYVFISPWTWWRLSLPLGSTGLLFVAPFYGLRDKWANIYMLALPLCVSALLVSIHMGLGSHHIVPATTMMPDGSHSLLALSGWAVFHATPILIGATLVVLGDMIFRKTNKMQISYKNWAEVTALVIAFALFVMPFRVTHTSKRVIESTPGSNSAQDSITTPPTGNIEGVQNKSYNTDGEIKIDAPIVTQDTLNVTSTPVYPSTQANGTEGIVPGVHDASQD